jgi:hypothetical protein
MAAYLGLIALERMSGETQHHGRIMLRRDRRLAGGCTHPRDPTLGPTDPREWQGNAA